MRLLFTSDPHRGYDDCTAKVHDKWAHRMAAEDFDAIAVAGDLASDQQHQYEGALKFWRRVGGNRPVMIVDGNHDYWCHTSGKIKRRPYVEDVRARHAELAALYNIHQLDHDGPLWIDGICFVGWNGWYGTQVQTKDQKYLPFAKDPRGVWSYLLDAAKVGFESALLAAKAAAGDDDTVVAVTHMPLHPDAGNEGFGGNQRWWDFIAPEVDYFLSGHRHLAHDVVIDGVRCINVGPDYNKPAHRILEIEP